MYHCEVLCCACPIQTIELRVETILLPGLGRGSSLEKKGFQIWAFCKGGDLSGKTLIVLWGKTSKSASAWSRSRTTCKRELSWIILDVWLRGADGSQQRELVSWWSYHQASLGCGRSKLACFIYPTAEQHLFHVVRLVESASPPWEGAFKWFQQPLMSWWWW